MTESLWRFPLFFKNRNCKNSLSNNIAKQLSPFLFFSNDIYQKVFLFIYYTYYFKKVLTDADQFFVRMSSAQSVKCIAYRRCIKIKNGR